MQKSNPRGKAINETRRARDKNSAEKLSAFERHNNKKNIIRLPYTAIELYKCAIIFSKSVILYWCTISGNNMIIYSLHMCIKFSLFHSICCVCLLWRYFFFLMCIPIQFMFIYGNASIYLFVHTIFISFIPVLYSLPDSIFLFFPCHFAFVHFFCVYILDDNLMHTMYVLQ